MTTDREWDYGDDIDLPDGCPKCDSENIVWLGGDSVVDIRGLHHFSWMKCEDCGHEWTAYDD